LPEVRERDVFGFRKDQQNHGRAAGPPKMLPMVPLRRNASLFTPQIGVPETQQGLVRHLPKRTASVFHTDEASPTLGQPRPSKRPKARQPSSQSESNELVLCSCNPRPDMTNSLSFTCRRCGQDQHATCAAAMRIAGKARVQALFCNDCHSTSLATANNPTAGLHATSKSSSNDAEYAQSMRSEIEALSSTILWKIWWDLPLSPVVQRDSASLPPQAPPTASQAFMLECTTRLSTLLTTAGQDLTNDMLIPALATFPRRPEVVLQGLRALFEAVMPNLRPPWSKRPRPRAFSEDEQSSFGVLLEIVGLVEKGDSWTYGRSIGWR
jgi:hypothetical protein